MAHSRIVKAAVITLLAFVTISIAVSAAPIGGNQGWYVPMIWSSSRKKRQDKYSCRF